MKAAFFHDVKLLRNKDNKYFSIGDFYYEIWKRYLEHFDELTVVTRCIEINDDNMNKYKIASGENVNFQSVPNLNNLSIIKNYRKAKRIIREVLSKVDCAIIRLPSNIGLVACHECIKMGKPWAVEVVGCAWDALWNHGSIKGKLVAPIEYFLNKYYIIKAPYAIYVSKSFLQRRYPCKGVSISCSDVNIFEPQQEVINKRVEKINKEFDGRPINFGMIGSLDVSYKGHETAIRALGSIKGDIPDFRLLLLGPGKPNKWQHLANSLGIGDKIIFCGTLPGGEAVLRWLDNIDIFLMPSLAESHGRALVEAMSRGCPAIGARTGGIPELLSEECIHKAKDYKMLSKIIIKFIKSKDLMKKLAIENFERSKEYSKNILDNERKKFWNQFKQYVQTKHSCTDTTSV
ncbi:MAG TPA: glycosyltransferase family 4 protein [Thermoanaerobacterium sp.]|nr:glycosyltransferase family 4 protein [Thermoanaerobacterium sp.]